MATGRLLWNYFAGSGNGRIYCDPPELFDSLERSAEENPIPIPGGDSFIFSFKFAKVIQLINSDGTTENHYSTLTLEKYVVLIRHFTADAETLSRQMIGSCSHVDVGPQMLENLAAELVSAALDAVQDPIVSSPDGPVAVPVFLCMAAFTQYDRREDFERAVEESVSGSAPAAEWAVEALEEVAAGLEGGEECSICLEELLSGDKDVVRLPCSHQYHRDCIVRWLGINHRCPFCRYAMPAKKEAF